MIINKRIEIFVDGNHEVIWARTTHPAMILPYPHDRFDTKDHILIRSRGGFTHYCYGNEEFIEKTLFRDGCQSRIMGVSFLAEWLNMDLE